MAIPVFNAICIPTSVNPVVGFSDRWDVVFEIQDYEGYWSGNDVAVGDLVFLDVQGAVPMSAPVCRYEVVDINSKGPLSVDVRVVYADTGDVVDPINAFYMTSYICRRNEYGFGYSVSPDIQRLASRVVDYARNYEMYVVLDEQMDIKAAKSDFETEVHMITFEEETEKKFSLTYTPAFPTEVVVDIIGGIKVRDGDDFIITGKDFLWGGRGLDGLLAAGDEVRATYMIS